MWCKALLELSVHFHVKSGVQTFGMAPSNEPEVSNSTAFIVPVAVPNTKPLLGQMSFSWLWIALSLLTASVALGQGDDRFVGVWTLDEGFQTVEFLFRSDGRYQLDKKSTDPVLDFSSTDRGRYEVSGQTLTLRPYEYLGEPGIKTYEFELIGDSLTLSQPEFSLTEVYQFKTGSRADVLAGEQVEADLVGNWVAYINFRERQNTRFVVAIIS
jgi:hypothetical protein